MEDLTSPNIVTTTTPNTFSFTLSQCNINDYASFTIPKTSTIIVTAHQSINNQLHDTQQDTDSDKATSSSSDEDDYPDQVLKFFYLFKIDLL